MKFRLILDKEREEEVVVTAHEETPFVTELRQLVLNHGDGQRITGYTEDGMKLLSVADVECITVLDSKLYAIDLRGEKYRLKHRLCDIEQQLPPYFIRINKSSVANEKRLERFIATYSGGVDAVFKCGYKEYVSRRCFAQIKRRLERR